MTKTWEQLSAIQPIGVKMLMNSIAKERISHAYLLEGGERDRKVCDSNSNGKEFPLFSAEWGRALSCMYKL